MSASIDAGLFLAGLIGGEDLARLVQLGIEYFPHPPAFARADLAEVTEAEKEVQPGTTVTGLVYDLESGKVQRA